MRKNKLEDVTGIAFGYLAGVVLQSYKGRGYAANAILTTSEVIAAIKVQY